MSEHPMTRLDPGAGEMAQRIQAFDWGSTSLGPMHSWSPALITTLRIMLANRFPHILWWGPEYIQFYNDAYRPIPGGKHPDRVLGVSCQDCWHEIWDVLKPLIDRPFHGGPATWNDDILLEINRHGFLEESHFTIAYSPVPDDTVLSGIGGVLATVHEITDKVVGQRRTGVLRDLGACIHDPKSGEEACAMAAESLREADRDLPFALLYLLDPDARRASLAGAAGAVEGEPVSPRAVDLDGPHPWAHAMTTALKRGTITTVRELGSRLASVPGGPWSDPPDMAAIVPIPASKAGESAGFLVTGVSARLRFDAGYHDFLDLVKTQIGTAIATARAYEYEKKRAELLAELDRAKTKFFSNVSHEFRTPLTLILGPLRDALETESEPTRRERLERIQRNALRLQKLVNTLLDFSRIEAGRVQASFEPVDLAELTRDLASSFRSGVEKAGMSLRVDCAPLSEPAYVDRDMWEKIVFNLLSNAFKFTLEGGIEVRLRAADGWAALAVRDTGVGIAPEELPRVFQRFHRVEGVEARTHEGTGIGLALASELVKLHGGTLTVESAVGQGSTFTAALPLGRAHLPADRVQAGRSLASTALAAEHYLGEALRWLPVATETPAGLPQGVAAPNRAGRPRILWADDNADMRDYVLQLLAPRYDVECVADGEAALEAIRREPPDLVLADIMMPRLDGLALLRALRESESTRTLPVILLSARAGEEAAIEGLEAGADHYLVKPFSARELLTRVSSHLELSRMRRENADLLRESDRRKDIFLAVLAHELRNPLAPIRNAASYLRRIQHGSPELKRPVEIIERQVSIMARLVDDLMDVSRISRGTLALRMGRVDLAEVVEAAVDGCRDDVSARGHVLTVILPERPLPIRGDRDRLVQILGNLVSNASKYTPDGGRIDVELKTGPGVIEATVRDNGRGIPRPKLREIFELFAQMDRTFDKEEGLGIGLSLAKQLVELHGGVIEARSEGAGRGSEFYVRLPRVAVEDAPRARATTPSGSPRRILVADDNEDSAESLKLFLEAHGHKVQVAYDGESALAAADRFRPDVAFIDIGMPKRSGYEVAEELRLRPWSESLRLIAVTGWGQESDRRRAQEVGFDAHLVKPATPEALLGLLASFDAPRAGRTAEPSVAALPSSETAASGGPATPA
ncbi:MAG TPA: ATP-binding protein [Candidatus Eisenbacteria bacterium]|nr:ATP-binding protein [Candidatus Eisenbacteria bacterium]